MIRAASWYSVHVSVVNRATFYCATWVEIDFDPGQNQFAPGSKSISTRVARYMVAGIVISLDFNQEQREEMTLACEQLNEDISRVKYVVAMKQQKRLDEAVANNLAVARTFLGAEKYRQYLRIINEDFNASGLVHVLNGTHGTK